MNKPSLPIAVVLGNAATGLYVIRELGKAGVRVHGVSRRLECGSKSRFLDRSAVCRTDDEVLEYLFRELSNQRPKPVLIPASDHYIDLVSNHAAELSSHFEFQASYADGLARSLTNKSALYDLCAKHDVALPNWMIVTHEDIRSVVGRLQFPIFLKPSQIHKLKRAMDGRKGWVVRNEDELKRIDLSRLRGNHEFIAQEIVPGPESDIALHCAYFDSQSRPTQAFTARKLRQYPPGFGSASLVVSETCEEAKEISERFLTAVGFRGIAASEFKWDPRDNRLKLIEINARPSLWFSLANAAGKNLALAAYNDLASTGLPLPEAEQDERVGWRYFARDLYTSYFYKKTSDFLLPKPDVEAYWRAAKRVDAVYCRDDPAPAVREWKSSMKGFLRRRSRVDGKVDHHI